MEAFRITFRDGFAPILSDKAMEALARGLQTDIPRIITGSTTSPPPLLSLQDMDVTAADPSAFALWHANKLTTVGEVERAWADVL